MTRDRRHYQHKRLTPEQVEEKRRRMREKRRREELAEHEECRVYRDKYHPVGVSFILVGVLFFFLYAFVHLFDGKIDEKKIVTSEVLGPYEFDEGNLVAVNSSVGFRISNTWCNLSVLLLDEHLNYLAGGFKDTYLEKTRDGTYKKTKMEYEIEIPKDGKYYIQILPKQSRDQAVGVIKTTVKSRLFGDQFYISIGLGLLIIGVIILGYLYNDYNWDDYIPSYENPKQRKKYKKYLIVGGGLALVILLFNIFHIGYAGGESFSELPSWFYSADDTVYFGN